MHKEVGLLSTRSRCQKTDVAAEEGIENGKNRHDDGGIYARLSEESYTKDGVEGYRGNLCPTVGKNRLKK